MPIRIKVGDLAPNFNLPDIECKLRSLSEFLPGTECKLQNLSEFINKNVVIAFFISAFTATCTKEMCAFRDSVARLIGLKAQVIGISTNDPAVNQAFAEKNKLPFPILSDYKGQVIKKYGVEKTNFRELEGYSVAKRSIFIVDKKGIIRYTWITDDPKVEPDYDQIEKTLATIT
ncbi:peroxiredoxin [Candidatus Bathyarchaeota archaeon]|nr:peroxiredoxin [Candidatus Bathyarchaeota archaeon]